MSVLAPPYRLPVEPERLARVLPTLPPMRRLAFLDDADRRESRGAAAPIVSDVCANGDGRPRAMTGSGKGRYSICRECYRALNAKRARERRADERQRRSAR